MIKESIKKEIRNIIDWDNPATEPKTEFIVGCSDIKVEIVTCVENPYKGMVNFALQTWGNNIHYTNKWKDLSPEARFVVTKETLEGRTLPLALEIPKFTFMISGISRAAADQHMRTRLGSVFAARGIRDSSAAEWPVIVPTSIAEINERFEAFKLMMNGIKEEYCSMLNSGQENWQSARAMLPMNIAYSIGWDINYQALKGVCARRLIETEQEDTVGSTVVMWHKVFEKFPLLAVYMKPAEDLRKKSLLKEVNAMPDILGLLFAANSKNPRWPLPKLEQDIKFNTAAADFTTIGEQTGYYLPRPENWPYFENYEDLPEIEKERFEEN